MKNVKTSVKDGVLTLVIDLNQSHGESSSGKSLTVATSSGNQPVEGYPNIKLGLNVYKTK